MLNVVMLNVVMLSVVMLSVVLLSVVMLSVAAPLLPLFKHFSSEKFSPEQVFPTDFDTIKLYFLLY
jgi:hypothetical protein